MRAGPCVGLGAPRARVVRQRQARAPRGAGGARRNGLLVVFFGAASLLAQGRGDALAAVRAAAGAYDSITIGGWRQRNRSLLRSDFPWMSSHQCAATPGPAGDGGGARPFAFTPARRWTKDRQPGPTVIPLLLVGDLALATGRALSLLRDEASFREWHRYVLSPFQITLLVLLAEGYTVQGAAGPQALMRRVGLRPASCDGDAVRGCALLAAMDEGYTLYAYDDDPTDAMPPSYVLVGRLTVREPGWIRRLTPAARESWRTATCPARIPYVLANNWYPHDLFRLRVLDLFDWFFKIDDDVKFLGTLPHHPVANASAQRQVFVHTSRWPSYDPDECALGSDRFKEEYLANESARCGRTVAPAAGRERWWKERRTVLAGNFLGGWLGLFASPQLLRFSKHWHAHSPGMWEHRWGDQQYWCNALGLVTRGPTEWSNLYSWRDRYFCHAGACDPKKLRLKAAARAAAAAAAAALAAKPAGRISGQTG